MDELGGAKVFGYQIVGFLSDCESAEVVLSIIDAWFEDNHKAAPNSALGMKSSIEYRLSIKNG